MAEEPSAAKGPKDRSPSFPFIPLQTAVERLIAFEETFKRHPAPAAKAGLAWSMKPDSSQAQQTLAALKAFGLVEYQGVSAARTASLSEDGRNLLRAQQDSTKKSILKRLALKPRAIEKYWQQWGQDRPIDPICLDELVLRGGFTENAARTFLRVYDSTIGYAGLLDSDKEESEPPAGEVAPEDNDLEAQAAAAAAARQAAEEAAKKQTPAGARRAVFDLTEGEVVITYPADLTPESVSDLQDYINVFMKKARREAGVQ